MSINGIYESRYDFNDPIVRGGSWYDRATSVDSRDYESYGTNSNQYTGFRIARNAE